MKNSIRIISAIIAAILCGASLAACANDIKPPVTDVTTDASATAEPIHALDIWDGTVATSFEGGAGSQETPYEIATAEQFAYFAAEINSGKNYTDKYFVLTADIDLANIPWTPIGNGIYAFMGNFDGNGYTINNLRISQSAHYAYEYPTGRTASYSDCGLFATVQDASILNVIIDGATIEIADTKSNNTHRVGVLCGSARTYQSNSFISNIAIKNATITADFSTNKIPQSLSIGGVIGYIYTYNNATTTISLVETDSVISLATSFSSRNYIGTVCGGVNTIEATFILKNCAAYQTLTPNPYQYYYGATDDFCGAIGKAQASSQPFIVNDVFSKLIILKPVIAGSKYFESEITAYAIIGEAYYHAPKDDPAAVGYNFKNVFGCVEHVEANTGEKNFSTELYNLPSGPNFAQVNCQGCMTLPENHGFDTTVWNLSDLSKPRLNEQ